MTEPAASTLGETVASLHWGDLPSEVRERTVRLVLDTFGAMIAGSGQPSSAPARAAARFHPGDQASIVGSVERLEASWAALVNGTAAHALELDDVTRTSSLHPGTVVVPAALALAEASDATPPAFLEAVVAGYEIMLRVGDALNPASAYRRGFHPTGVAGAFGGAAAASRIIGLDGERTAWALGIAGTMAAGSLEYLSDGSWTKRLNAGWAAHAGIAAAQLAAAGFTGPRTALDGPLGFLHAYSDEADPTLLIPAAGEPLRIMTVAIKPYACCRYNHGIIDALLRIRQREGFRLEAVERIRLGILTAGRLLVADPPAAKRTPENVVDAQFSAPFAAAVALIDGAAGAEQYTRERIHDARVVALMGRTECISDPALDADYPRLWRATAEVTLSDGSVLAESVDHALGEPENPVSDEQLAAKFKGLLADLLAPSQVSELARLILGLGSEPNLAPIYRQLRAVQIDATGA